MTIRALAIAMGIICMALGVVSYCGGCHEMTPQEKSAVADSTYAGEMLACVEKAKTREESQDCRADVRKKWGVDGGAR